jgi:hypothetical protein
MFVLAAVQHFCARFTNAFLTSLSPLTYERGDALMAFEEEHECLPCPSLTRQADSPPSVGGEGPDGVVRHSPASAVGVPTLPMFTASDLRDIASDYLVHHFPWPDGDGKFGCTCGTQGFTIATWSVHVGELQISELVFYLTGLLYDQTQK